MLLSGDISPVYESNILVLIILTCCRHDSRSMWQVLPCLLLMHSHFPRVRQELLLGACGLYRMAHEPDQKASKRPAHTDTVVMTSQAAGSCNAVHRGIPIKGHKCMVPGPGARSE